MPFFGRFIVAGALICYGLVSQLCVQASPQSSLWLTYSDDEENARDTTLDIYWGVSEDDVISLGVGQSQSELLGEVLNTDHYHLGYETLRMAPFAIDIFYEYWGKSHELDIKTAGIGLTYLAASTTLGLNLEYRDVNIFTREFFTGQRRIQTSALGYGPTFELYVDELTWSLTAMWYDYSDDPTRLNALKVLYLLGLRTYDRASALNDWQVAAGLRYRFSEVTLGVHYLRSQSAIVKTESEVYAIRLGVNTGNNWLFELEGGQVNDETADAYRYGLLSIGYQFP